jgi:hypothetical protein
LVAGERLGAMDARLFTYLFGAAYYTNCQYRGERQVCVECRYVGKPVNILPFEPEAAPPLPPDLDPPSVELLHALGVLQVLGDGNPIAVKDLDMLVLESVVLFVDLWPLIAISLTPEGAE